MIKSLAFAGAFGLVAAVAQGAAAQAGGVEATRAWSRPAAAGATGAGFMTLLNRGKAPDALVAAESPLARKVEIHRSSVKDGVASMRRLDRVETPAGSSVTFAPGGLHLMFLGLTKPLAPGDALPVTLTFASGAKLKVAFQVSVAPPADPHAHH